MCHQYELGEAIESACYHIGGILLELGDGEALVKRVGRMVEAAEMMLQPQSSNIDSPLSTNAAKGRVGYRRSTYGLMEGYRKCERFSFMLATCATGNKKCAVKPVLA